MAQATRMVKVIPQTIHTFTQKGLNEMVKRKVAAYARIFTNSEEQLTSYEA